jgi:hypothetical protein
VTYSLAIKGVRADNPPQIQNNTLSDANAREGNQSNAMQNNTAFLCKGPDGAERLYQIDASRSIPGQTPVLLAVGP